MGAHHGGAGYRRRAAAPSSPAHGPDAGGTGPRLRQGRRHHGVRRRHPRLRPRGGGSAAGGGLPAPGDRGEGPPPVREKSGGPAHEAQRHGTEWGLRQVHQPSAGRRHRAGGPDPAGAGRSPWLPVRPAPSGPGALPAAAAGDLPGRHGPPHGHRQRPDLRRTDPGSGLLPAAGLRPQASIWRGSTGRQPCGKRWPTPASFRKSIKKKAEHPLSLLFMEFFTAGGSSPPDRRTRWRPCSAA